MVVEDTVAMEDALLAADLPNLDHIMDHMLILEVVGEVTEQMGPIVVDMQTIDVEVVVEDMEIILQDQAVEVMVLEDMVEEEEISVQEIHMVILVFV